MVDQITVFLENEAGHLAALCRTLGDAGINMHALMLADTSEFGVVRVICDAPAKAARILEAAGYRASITKVAAIEIPNRAGGLADVLECLQQAGINVEYAYCFASANKQCAIDVVKIHEAEHDALGVLEKAGYTALQPEDLYAPHEL
jgi:hypothetical protein